MHSLRLFSCELHITHYTHAVCNFNFKCVVCVYIFKYILQPSLLTHTPSQPSLLTHSHSHSVSLYTVDGNKIAQSTGMDILLQSDFDLKMNDFKYRVEVPSDCELIRGASY